MTKFAESIIKIAFFTVLTQLMLVLASPILTRIFSPESLGVLALFTTVSSIIGSISCFRLELAIPLPESEGEGYQIYLISVLTSMIVSVLIFTIIFIFKTPLLQYPFFQPLSNIFYFIPFTICMVGIISATNYLFIRKKYFTLSAFTSFIIAVVTITLQILLPFILSSEPFVLVIGKNFGMLAGILIIVILLFKLFRNQIRFDLRGSYELCKRYKNFIQYDIGATLLNVVSWNLPALILNYFFTTTIIGYYSLAFMVIQAPMGIVGNALNQVLYQKTAEDKNKGKPSSELIFYGLKKIVGITLIPSLTIFLFGQVIFSIIFGQTWEEAGLYAQILIIWGFFWFISSPFSSIIYTHEEQMKGLLIQIFIFIGRFFSLIIGGIIGQPWIALLLYSLSGVVTYGYLLVQIYGIVQIPKKNLLSGVISEISTWKYLIIILIFLKFLSIPSIYIFLSICVIFGFFLILLIKSNYLPVNSLKGMIIPFLGLK